MRCPFCSYTDTRVIDSRVIGDGDSIRRRRQCEKCNDRFTSYETAELRFPIIVKVDGRREVFNETKLRTGILRAIEKRPVATEMAETAIATVKHKLCAQGEREMHCSQLGDWVMSELRALDKVAYIRFASVYKNFEDVDEFLEEIKRIENDLPPDIQENQLQLLNFDGTDN